MLVGITPTQLWLQHFLVSADVTTDGTWSAALPAYFLTLFNRVTFVHRLHIAW